MEPRKSSVGVEPVVGAAIKYHLMNAKPPYTFKFVGVDTTNAQKTLNTTKNVVGLLGMTLLSQVKRERTHHREEAGDLTIIEPTWLGT